MTASIRETYMGRTKRTVRIPAKMVTHGPAGLLLEKMTPLKTKSNDWKPAKKAAETTAAKHAERRVIPSMIEQQLSYS